MREENPHFSQHIITIAQELMNSDQAEYPYLGSEEAIELLEYLHTEDYVELCLNGAMHYNDLYPFNTEIRLQIAHCHASMGDIEQAFEYAEQLHNLAPFEEGIILFIIELCFELQDYEKIIEFSSKIQANSRDYPTAQYFYLVACLHLRKEQEIYEVIMDRVINKTLSTDQLDVLAHSAYDEAKWGKRIQQLLKQCIDEDPYHAGLWLCKGQIYHYYDQYDEAIDAFDYAIAIDEKLKEAIFYKILCFIKTDNTSSIIALEEDLEEDIYFSFYQYLSLAEAYKEQAMYEQTIEALRKASYYHTEHHQLTSLYAETFYLLNEYDKAYQFFTQLLDLSQGEEKGRVYYNLAVTQSKMGLIDAVYECFEKALQYDLHNGHYWLSYAQFYFKNQDFKSCLELLEKGIEETEGDYRLLYYKVIVHLATGKKNAAMESLHLALLTAEDEHEVLYSFVQEVEAQKILFKMVQYFLDDEEDDSK